MNRSAFDLSNGHARLAGHLGLRIDNTFSKHDHHDVWWAKSSMRCRVTWLAAGFPPLPEIQPWHRYIPHRPLIYQIPMVGRGSRSVSERSHQPPYQSPRYQVVQKFGMQFSMVHCLPMLTFLLIKRTRLLVSDFPQPACRELMKQRNYETSTRARDPVRNTGRTAAVASKHLRTGITAIGLAYISPIASFYLQAYHASIVGIQFCRDGEQPPSCAACTEL